MQLEHPPERHEAVPHLKSDSPDTRRTPVPREDALRRWWRERRLAHGTRPVAGALIVGGLGVALAMEVGVGELVLGVLSGYAAYRMLRYGIDLRQALTETVELEKIVRDL